MDRYETLVRRKNTAKSNLSITVPPVCSSTEAEADALEATKTDEPELTLMEEVLLLAIKDKEGLTSYWNDCLSYGLRACALVELSLKNRIALDNSGVQRRRLLSKKIVVINEESTDDTLLDETIRIIKLSRPPESTQNWIEYLSGESWNPFKMKYQLRNVRERLAKNLVEKGILTNDKKSYLFFDVTTHPIVNVSVKQKIIKKIQDSLTDNWVGDIRRMDKRILALILLAGVSEVLENALFELNDEKYMLASQRIDELKNLNYKEYLQVTNTFDVMWVVLEIISK